jgi:hypothetical protein
MPKVLFLGCNHNQIPYMVAARRNGFYVIATDLNPQATGAGQADRFHCAGYDDLDALLKVARQEGLCETDRIFTAAAHFAWEGAAHVAKAIGIPFISPASVDVCLNKVKFYELLREYNFLPPSEIYRPDLVSMLDKAKAYYLKSDYGKSPHYCYRVTNGDRPPIPKTHDRYYRKHFIVQEEIVGLHYRVDLYGDQAAVFLKIRDDVCLPLPCLGPGHSKVYAALADIVRRLGLAATVTKFDLVANGEEVFVLDIGLDPPFRLKSLHTWLGLDFADAYARHSLLGDVAAIRPWCELCRPLVISGTPAAGLEFIDTTVLAPHGREF